MVNSNEGPLSQDSSADALSSLKAQAALERLATYTPTEEQRRSNDERNRSSIIDLEMGCDRAAAAAETWSEAVTMLRHLLNNMDKHDVYPLVPVTDSASVPESPEGSFYGWAPPLSGVNVDELVANMKHVLRDASALAMTYQREVERCNKETAELYRLLNRETDPDEGA